MLKMSENIMTRLDKSGNRRLIWADSLKGFLILLVILGHSIQYTLGNACYFNHLWNIIYSFHMPAFMAISGFLAYRDGGGHFIYMVNNMEASQTVDDYVLFVEVIDDANWREC